MVYLTSRLDAWMLHRLSGTAVLALLPGGTATGQASIFNNTRPQQGGTAVQFVSFHQAGAMVDMCMPASKHGVTADYYTQAWQPGDDTHALEPLMDAIEAQFMSNGLFLAETYNGYRFTVLAQDAEPQQVDTSQGVLYSSTGYRWRIAAEVAP